MLGVFPVLEWTRKLDNGWEARVEAKTLSGAIVGAAEAECTRDERAWASRDDFALRSMAQTRATAKALRMPLGFVMTLGGFQATPAEEMTFDSGEREQARAGARAAQPAPAAKKAAMPAVKPPLCPTHQVPCNLVPAGTSKASGKAYGAFWSCPDRTCTANAKTGKGFSIFATDWDDILSQQAQDARATETVDLDDLPNEQ